MNQIHEIYRVRSIIFNKNMNIFPLMDVIVVVAYILSIVRQEISQDLLQFLL